MSEVCRKREPGMPRRGFALGLGSLVAFCGPRADAQPRAGVPRIGVLTALPPAANSARLDALRQGLQELGHFEGQSILVEQRSAEGRLDRLPALAAEVVTLNVDVILSGGPAATQPARAATPTIPIVMTQDPDPVGNGFVASLARPGGNVTGLSNLSPDLIGKQLELLKEIVPRLTRVAVVGHPGEPGNDRALQETRQAATRLGVQVHYSNTQKLEDLQVAFRSARGERAEAMLVLNSPLAATLRKQIAELAVTSRLPVMHQVPEFVDDGGLVAYGVSVPDLWRRAATYVDKILRGARPADLPVEQPTRVELIFNLKAARQIGLTIPPGVLARADRVIK